MNSLKKHLAMRGVGDSYTDFDILTYSRQPQPPTLSSLIDTESVLINLSQKIQPPWPYSTLHA